jgi:hypothetical protein
MRMQHALAIIVVIAVLCSGLGGVAVATPHRSAPVLVQLDPGGRCWTYRGTFDGFTLRVTGGDRLLISTAGEMDLNDGTHSWKVVEPRDVAVEKGSEIVRPDERSVYRFGSSGDFKLLLGPAAIRGLPSMLIVCRAPPEVSLGH